MTSKMRSFFIIKVIKTGTFHDVNWTSAIVFWKMTCMCYIGRLYLDNYLWYQLEIFSKLSESIAEYYSTFISKISKYVRRYKIACRWPHNDKHTTQQNMWAHQSIQSTQSLCLSQSPTTFQYAIFRDQHLNSSISMSNGKILW